MNKLIKFGAKVKQVFLEDCKKSANELHKNISRILTVVIKEYRTKINVRPVFRNASAKVISENEQLLKRLAK